MHQFLKFIFGLKLCMFRQFLCPSSGVFHCTHSNGLCHTCLLTAASRIRIEFHPDPACSCEETCITYTIAVCTVKNSWWWTEELSKTCRACFQNKFEKLVHLVCFIIRTLSRCTVAWMPRSNTFSSVLPCGTAVSCGILMSFYTRETM
jgi:hypothetical protein